MYPEHRLRIIAYLVDIGKQLNELPEDDLSSIDHGRLLHLMDIRDSLTSALTTGAAHRPVVAPARLNSNG